MAKLKFPKLKTKYNNFKGAAAIIKVNDVALSSKKAGLATTDLIVDLSSGFEASTCEFKIVDIYSPEASEFLIEKVKKYIYLGSKVEVFLGYSGSAMSVFIGYISAVNFVFDKEFMPYIKVTAMDIKGIMMSSNYCYQLKATTYSQAVEEILQRTAYSKLKDSKIIVDIKVSDTPDEIARKASGGQQQETTDKTIEMVGESDYDFVVRVAKRYNFEFFTHSGVVYFRKAKSDESILMEIGSTTGLVSFDVGYDVTGIVEAVEARGVDPSKAKVLTSTSKYGGKLSNGNKGFNLIKGSKKVYVDPSISSSEEAENRAKSLHEQNVYRYGRLEAELIGLPQYRPGTYVMLNHLGKGADNKFYITRVRHIMNRDGNYFTELTGVCMQQYKQSML